MLRQVYLYLAADAGSESSSSESSILQVHKHNQSQQAEIEHKDKPFKPRKMKADPEKWARNIRKKLRVTGQEYVSITGKIVNQRKMKADGCNCRLKCMEKFTAGQRQEIFDAFWSSGCYERQRDFVCQNVTKKEVRQRRKETTLESARRNRTFEYHFNGTKVRF